jgi:hypothetical protein
MRSCVGRLRARYGYIDEVYAWKIELQWQEIAWVKLEEPHTTAMCVEFRGDSARTQGSVLFGLPQANMHGNRLCSPRPHAPAQADPIRTVIHCLSGVGIIRTGYCEHQGQEVFWSGMCLFVQRMIEQRLGRGKR